MERDSLGKFKKIHGYNRTLTYRSWESMKARCTLTKNPFYKKYLERNISVCPEWYNSFEAFLKDMGERPSKGHTLDRIDNDKGYYKDNCRWATKREQAINRRTTRIIEFNGKKLSLKDVSLRLGLSYNAVLHRLNNLGWSLDEALTTPIRKRRKNNQGTH